MRQLFSRKPSPSMVVACVALFVALGGGAYATVGANQVRSVHIKNGQVRTADIANSAITSIKIARNAVRSNTILNGSIAGVDIAPKAITPTHMGGIPAARVYSSAILTAPAGGMVPTPLAFNQERYDTGTLHDTAANTHRFSITQTGVYSITAHVTWSPNASGSRELMVRKNGTIVARAFGPANGVNAVDQSVATMTSLTTGDVVDIAVRQSSGVDLSIVNAQEFSPEAAIAWVAPLP